MKTTRRLLQFGFLALTLIGVYGLRGHAERWCPFGGVEAAYGYVHGGDLICSLSVSNFYVLAGVLLLALLVRRAFCGYACPIGTLSEWLQRGGRRLGLRPVRVPYALDRTLALLKYPVLGIILYFTWKAGELAFRGYDPCYALISRHGTDITFWAYVVGGVIALGSLILMVPFCRWLCPLAAVFAPFSRVGLTRIKRDAGTCTDCGACTRACPMGIRVDKAAQVTAARCTSCFECVAACDQVTRGLNRNAAQPPAAPLIWGPPRFLGRRWPKAAVVVVLLLCVGGAVAASYLFPLPSFVRTIGTPPARTAAVLLRVRGANCRHSTELFVQQLERRDEFKVRGYLRVEAWPNPDASPIRITYDPAQASETAIKRAITEPIFDTGGRLRVSAYEVEGYDLLVDD
jgi:ferredoxin